MFDIYKGIDEARLTAKIKEARLHATIMAPYFCVILEMHPKDIQRLREQTHDIVRRPVLYPRPRTYARNEPVPDPEDTPKEHYIDTYEGAEIRATENVPEGIASVLLEIGG